MPEMKILKVGVRMLIDYLKVQDEHKEGYEIGCKCLTPEIANDLARFIGTALEGYPGLVELRDQTIVVIRDPNLSYQVIDGTGPDSEAD